MKYEMRLPDYGFQLPVEKTVSRKLETFLYGTLTFGGHEYGSR